jgi:hypothetical protein
MIVHHVDGNPTNNDLDNLQVREAPPQTKTTRDVLLHAALLIEERGWCRVDRQDADGHLCLVGAIEVAQFGSVYDTEADWNPSISLEQLDPFGLPAVAVVTKHVGAEKAWHWNDAPGRTAAEVISALRAAADAA